MHYTTHASVCECACFYLAVGFDYCGRVLLDKNALGAAPHMAATRGWCVSAWVGDWRRAGGPGGYVDSLGGPFFRSAHTVAIASEHKEHPCQQQWQVRHAKYNADSPNNSSPQCPIRNRCRSFKRCWTQGNRPSMYVHSNRRYPQFVTQMKPL